MRSLQRILAATDFSEASALACDRAVELADRHGAELVLLHVAEVAPLVPAWGDPGGGAWISEELLLEGLRDRLVSHAGALTRRTGVAVRPELRLGSPHREIAREALRESADLVVLGTHGSGGVLARLLGSTAQNTLRLCEAPVLAVRAGLERPYVRALCATDFSVAARLAAHFALRLVPGLALDLLHVLPDGLGRLAAFAQLGEDDARRQLEAAMADATAALAREARGLGEHVGAVVRRGDPVAEIETLLRDQPPDLLVLGAHGRTRLEAGLLGSVSQRLLGDAACDVLMLREPRHD